MNALLTDVHLRSVVAAIRALGCASVGVVALGSTRGAAGLFSRYAAHRAVGPGAAADRGGFARRVAELAAEHGPVVVYPGQESTIDALLAAPLPPGAALPYARVSALNTLRDKRRLPELAAEAGLRTPATVAEGSARELRAARLPAPAAVKPLQAGGALRSTTLLGSEDELRVLLERLPDEEPLLAQERVRGPLAALALVIDRSGGIAACFHQVTRRTWPSDAGISSEAVSVEPDEQLALRCAALLRAIGFSGLVQLQFIDAPEGPLLIDVNPRFYGSLPLALAAGVNLPATWHAAVTGGERPEARGYRVGVTYRWLEADVVDAFHGERRLLLRRVERPRVGAVWARDDPLPSLVLAAEATRRRAAGRLRRESGGPSRRP